MKLNDAVILVTGGAHRVGKAIALALAGEKAHIAFTYSASEAAAIATTTELQALGVDVLAVHCDQSINAQIDSTVQTVLQHFGRMDGLVNSASIMQTKTFMETTQADWDEALAINTRGPFFFSQAAARVMLERGGGAIVNILDESAFAPARGCIQHSVSKTGLWAITRSLALVLAPTIRVNAVVPGAVLIPQGWSQAQWLALKDGIPLNKLGTAEDVARAVVYLMKEDFITGQFIGVDGGSSLRG